MSEGKLFSNENGMEVYVNMKTRTISIDETEFSFEALHGMVESAKAGIPNRMFIKDNEVYFQQITKAKK